MEAKFISGTSITDELSLCVLGPVRDSVVLDEKMFLGPQGHITHGCYFLNITGPYPGFD